MNQQNSLERQITHILRHMLPLALTITPRPDGHYIWQWMEQSGEASTFVEAVAHGLTQMQVASLPVELHESGQEEDELVMLLLVRQLYAHINTLRRTETHDIVIPGPGGSWTEAMRESYRVRGHLETLLDEVLSELDAHHQREARAEEMYIE